MHPAKQPSPRSALKNFTIVVIVAGTRGWNNYDLFSWLMHDYVKDLSEKPIFVSGAAKTGADKLIITWCKEFSYDWVEFPADWDTYGKSAGYIRNAEMGKIATHLVTFYDCRSRGTRHMIDFAEGRKLNSLCILIDTSNEDIQDERESESSGASSIQIYREIAPRKRQHKNLPNTFFIDERQRVR